MKLILPIEYICHNSWNFTLNKLIARSGLFEVETRRVSSKANPLDQYFPYPNVNGARNNLWTPMELDGCLIGLDTWDTLGPTWNFENTGLFNTTLSKIDLVIKIQHHNCGYWNDFTDRTKKRSSAWVVMPTHNFPLDPPPFKWEDKNHKFIVNLSGRNNRFGRPPWVHYMIGKPEYYVKEDCVSLDPQNVYLNILKNTKWGLILKGRKGAEKNRREVEFSALGMPMVLNYVPEYPFKMEPNKHFIFIEKPEDLEKLKDIDPKPFAEASTFLWENYFSPIGMAKTLIKVVHNESFNS